MRKSFSILLLVLLIFSATYNLMASPKKIVLQVKWKHQFQFAGYYAAIEKGFYDELGIELEIREFEVDRYPMKEVLAGNADFGIGSIEVLGNFLNGEPVVILASIFQHSPNILIVKEGSDIFNPHDLVGKSIMLESDERGFELLGMLMSEGINPNQVKFVDRTHSINDFLANKVDALSAYSTNEPYFLQSYGIPYRIIKPSTYGIDFYSDCLFTTRSFISKNPQLVHNFIDASLRGWQYALNNKEEIATLIISKYNSTKSIDHLLFEANEIHKLVNPEFVEIGHINRGRWESMANFLFHHGLIKEPTSLQGLLFTDEYSSSSFWPRFLKISLITGAFTLIIGLFFYLRVSRIVSKRTKDIQLLVNKLEEQNKKITTINTELIAAREAAEESLKDKSTFFAGLIAELKTPLNGLVRISQEIASEGITDHQKQNLNQSIQKWSRVLNLFTQDITSVLSISPSAERLSYKIANPSLFLREFIENTPPLLEFDTEQIVIIDQNNNFSVPVLIDSNKVSRVLEILISNALKHSPKARIELGCIISETDTFTFWVSDDGKGITNEQFTQFNEFFSSPLKSFVKGVGYGLTLVKALVKLLGGEIQVSNLENQTTFKFNIPCIQLDPLDYNENTFKLFSNLPNDALTVLKGKTILFHDQNPNNFILFRSMLDGTGCTLVHSQTMDKTQSLSLGFNDIDIIIMSVSVLSNPEIDFLAKIRSFKHDLPIIADISYEFDQRSKYLTYGFTDIIQRPNSRAQMITKIIEHLG